MRDPACPLHNYADAHFAKQEFRILKETLHQNDHIKLHVKFVRFCKASHIITALEMPPY